MASTLVCNPETVVSCEERQTNAVCIAGVPWKNAGLAVYHQRLGLTFEQASALRGGRLEKLQSAADAGVHLQLLIETNKESNLLITGSSDQAVSAARELAVRELDKAVGTVIPLHAEDADMLWRERRDVVAEIERQSGCRIVVDYRSKKQTISISCARQDSLQLLGDASSQAHAVQLLARHCKHPVVRWDISGVPLSFHSLNHASSIHIGSDGTMARRVRCDEHCNPQNCIVVGSGPIGICELGHFFAFAVRKLDLYRGLRGGTRIGVSMMSPNPPLPTTLQMGFPFTWVVGRRVVHGSDRSSVNMEAADFDVFPEGDEIGILVTKDTGSIVALHRKNSSDPAETWKAFMRWDAEVVDTHNLYVLFELSGRLLEIELVERQLPADVDLSLHGELEQAVDQPTLDIEESMTDPEQIETKPQTPKEEDTVIDGE